MPKQIYALNIIELCRIDYSSMPLPPRVPPFDCSLKRVGIIEASKVPFDLSYGNCAECVWNDELYTINPNKPSFGR